MQLNAFISFRIFKELNEALPSEREAPYERMRFRTLSYGGSVTGVVGLDGFEPSTPALSRRCSNRLSYRPDRSRCHIQPTDKRGRRKHHSKRRSKTALFKGGDPAAPSGTATLLRLHPSHETHRGRRPPCG